MAKNKKNKLFSMEGFTIGIVPPGA